MGEAVMAERKSSEVIRLKSTEDLGQLVTDDIVWLNCGEGNVKRALFLGFDRRAETFNFLARTGEDIDICYIHPSQVIFREGAIIISRGPWNYQVCQKDEEGYEPKDRAMREAGL